VRESWMRSPSAGQRRISAAAARWSAMGKWTEGSKRAGSRGAAPLETECRRRGEAVERIRRRRDRHGAVRGMRRRTGGWVDLGDGARRWAAGWGKHTLVSKFSGPGRSNTKWATEKISGPCQILLQYVSNFRDYQPN
jgi:hypothetical protein